MSAISTKSSGEFVVEFVLWFNFIIREEKKRKNSETLKIDEELFVIR
jgi:hypothetical protein